MITKTKIIAKITKASRSFERPFFDEKFPRNANEVKEGPRRNSENSENYKNCENNENLEILLDL